MDGRILCHVREGGINLKSEILCHTKQCVYIPSLFHVCLPIIRVFFSQLLSPVVVIRRKE